MATALKVQDRVHEPLSAPVTGSSSEIIIPRDSLLLSDCCKAINGAKATEPFATLFLQPPRSSKTAMFSEGAAKSGSTKVEASTSNESFSAWGPPKAALPTKDVVLRA